MQTSDFDKFARLLTKWKNAYVSAIYSFVALKTKEGHHLLSGKIVFSPAQLIEQSFRFETQHILAGRFVKKITVDDLESALIKGKEGVLNTLNGSISLGDRDQGRGQLSYYLRPIEYPFRSSLSICGMTKHDLYCRSEDLRELDTECKTADSPFESLDDVLSYCGLLPTTRQGDSTTLELIVDAPASFERGLTINSNEVLIGCHAAKAFVTDGLKLGYQVSSIV